MTYNKPVDFTNPACKERHAAITDESGTGRLASQGGPAQKNILRNNATISIIPDLVRQLWHHQNITSSILGNLLSDFANTIKGWEGKETMTRPGNRTEKASWSGLNEAKIGRFVLREANLF